ncbi:MAG TPA: hypothetical protein VIY29_00645 [Ktedonobacteraceae bacterium]
MFARNLLSNRYAIQLLRPGEELHDGANATQASILLANYAIVGAKYKAMLRWMTGEEVKPEEIDSFLASPQGNMPEEWRKQIEERREAYAGMLADRSAIEIVTL